MRKLSIVLVLFSFVSVMFAQNHVSIAEAKELIKKEKKVLIVDVRTPAEFNAGHLDKAINIDFYAPSFKADILKLSKKRPILLYCRSGRRSALALQIMRENGYSKVYNMLGGYRNWK